MTEASKCRLCNSNVRIVIDLCMSPPANNFVEDFYPEEIESYPLFLEYCDDCYNLQLGTCLDESLLYKNYNYITPDSNSLKNHYIDIERYINKNVLRLSEISVLEIGSNNGALLAHLKPHVKSILGVDPASNVSKIANKNGINTLNHFFHEDIVPEIHSNQSNTNLIIARHMFAHNAQPSKILEAAKKTFNGYEGHLVIENAYAIDTLLNGELDQIYHEHMFFYSALSMKSLLEKHGFYMNDIFFSKVHGGSAVFISSTKKIKESDRLLSQLDLERDLFDKDKVFLDFESRILHLKNQVLDNIKQAKTNQKKIIAYGAPAKAFTMFAYLGLSSSTIQYCVDTTPTKIGKTFPSFNIPIIAEEDIDNSVNKLIIVNAWNYREEIIAKASKIFRSGDILLFPLPNFYLYEVA